MSKSSQQLFYLKDEQLIKLVGQGTYPGAEDAWNRSIEIRDAGGDPKVFYSKDNGFNVLDDNDPDNMHRIISMEDRAKRFSG